MARYDNDYGGWPPYVPVAERRAQAERAVAKLRKQGKAIEPVVITKRAIAGTFWGKAWCDNLERYSDFAYRLERGRSYVRNGAVLDLQITPLEVKGLVLGSETYTVAIKVAAPPELHWSAICRDCAGGIDSLVELLQGRLSTAAMTRICREGDGLFPKPSEITFSCSCPDYASMCKHVAALLYGVGARLDEKPDLLFRLRAVDEHDLLSHLNTDSLVSTTTSADRILESDDMAALFGLEMSSAEVPADAGQSAIPGAGRREAGRSKAKPGGVRKR